MKTKQFFLSIVALAFIVNAFATEIPKVSIIPLEDTKALITVQQTTPYVSEITITTESDRVVYYKKTKKEADVYKKIFDLSQLDDGKYRVTMKAGTTTVKKDLLIKSGKISVLKQRNEQEPYFAYNNNKVVVSYLNFSREDMKVYVYDSKELVFSEKIGNDVALHRMLNMKALRDGNYDILLANAYNEYWFSFSK